MICTARNTSTPSFVAEVIIVAGDIWVGCYACANYVYFDGHRHELLMGHHPWCEEVANVESETAVATNNSGL